MLEEVGPLEPPVAEELGVEGRDQDRRRASTPSSLRARGDGLALGDEVAGVLPGALVRGGGIVGLLVRAGAGDAVRLEPRHQPRPVRAELAQELALWQVEADVAIELAVRGVAGVAHLP